MLCMTGLASILYTKKICGYYLYQGNIMALLKCTKEFTLTSLCKQLKYVYANRLIKVKAGG